MSSRWLGEIGIQVIAKFPQDRLDSGTSGVVIAGYGEDEIFPSLRSYFVDAIIGGRLKYLHRSSDEIGSASSAVVTPFAQSDMVYMFMEGIDPDYKETVEAFTLKLLLDYPEQILDVLSLPDDDDLKKTLRRIGTLLFKRYSKELQQYRSATYAEPVVTVFSMLPKDELAAAAETLVTITAVRRRFSMDVESVGGPTDVAVISKGDGFIWIKRKHYFDPRLNHHFLETYLRETPHVQEGAREEA